MRKSMTNNNTCIILFIALLASSILYVLWKQKQKGHKATKKITRTGQIIPEFFEKARSETEDVKVRFLSDYFVGKGLRYNMQSFEQFCRYFLQSSNVSYRHVSKDEKADICIIDIYYDVNEDDIRPNEFNILISIENIPKWKTYKFITKYGETNEKIDLYYYNHYSNFSSTKKNLRPIIPTAYAYIREFLYSFYSNYKHKDFETKKDVLIINRSGLNTDVEKYKSTIEKNSKLKLDNISMYSDVILNKSCYHSPELIEVFSQYKFILCVENSYHNGYITEKIFNCFLACSIPLYSGAPDIETFIDKDAFINLNDKNWFDRLLSMSLDQAEYLKMVGNNKIVVTGFESRINQELSKHSLKKV
jgi:hypothetical protein